MAKGNKDAKIGPAQLEFGPNGVPQSSNFHDTYFDIEDGLAESRHVFIKGCDLERHWAGQDSFTIGETGFGTGLNFLAAWHAWRTCSDKSDRLNYVAVEGYPLTGAELETCHKPYPELTPLMEKLVAAYPSPHPGYHRLYFDNSAVTLTLLFGPVLAMLESLDADVDAWFLDGFAPDRNPDMWSPEVFKEIARLSNATTRLATFTVAGPVRKGLQTAGFEVDKAPGFGKKRENLRARYTGTTASEPSEPWFRLPTPRPPEKRSVAIIGSGLAGASAAYAFRRRNFSVTVIERHANIASEASAAPAAIFMPRLTAGHSTDGAFYAAAWQTLLPLLHDIERCGKNIGLNQCGALRLATSSTENDRQKAIIESGVLSKDLLRRVTATEASEIAGINTGNGGLYFPNGGFLSPHQFCEALFDEGDKRVRGDARKLARENGQWLVTDEHGEALERADCVVLACGLDSSNFEHTSWLPLTARRGQLTTIAENDRSRSLTCVLADEGHITPVRDGYHWIGATFDHIAEQDKHERIPSPSLEADERNIRAAGLLTPTLVDPTKHTKGESWAGIRCTTRDHLPLAGPLPVQASYLHDYSELRHGHRWSQYPQANYHDGLYVLTGLGAHGVVAAPLAADLIASQANGDPLPIPREISNALHPGRFIVRDLKRGKT